MLRYVPDEGVRIEVGGEDYFVKASYLGFHGQKLLVCLEFASPTASEPVKTFMKSYTRIRGARYAVVLTSEELWIFDVLKNEEVKEIEYSACEVKADPRDLRVAAAFYNLIHCCGDECEDYSVCGLSAQR